MPTPLYDALRALAGKNTLRLHMPGHKGNPLPAPELSGISAIDFTELPGTGNLYEPGEPFDAAQALWAERFGFDHCQFLTDGSTLGLHTGLALLCRPGDKVLVDRGCHRSVFHAMALLDLEPVYLPRPWLEGEGVAGPFSPSDVEKALDAHPEVKTVCITSPTYCGLLSDIPAISRLVHRRGGKLLVDGAHGAHLPFLGIDAFGGADAAAVSAHKTLPAMGQSALLFTRGIDPDRVRRTAAIFGTSSPSYPMLASLDLARDYMEREGTKEYRRVAGRAAALRERFPCLAPPLPLDPCRLTVSSPDGPALTTALEALGVFPEMEDGGHVVCILTCADTDADLDRLEDALEQNRALIGPRAEKLPPPPLPERALSLRRALFAPSLSRPLANCCGEIAAAQIAPYPPGVPVIAPGERIGKKELAYLQEIGYNIRSETRIVAR